MKKKRFLYKIVAAYGVIALLYTLTGMGVFLYKTYEFTNYQFENNNKQYLLQIRDNLDTKMAVALNIVQQMKSNEKIIRYNKETEKEPYNITKIHEELQLMVNSFADYGLTLGIQRVSDEFVISSKFTTEAYFYYKELGFSRDNIALLERFKIEEGAPLILVLPHNEEGKYWTIVKKEAVLGGEDMLFYMSFFRKSMFPPQEKNYEAFALADSEGVVMASSASSPALEAWPQMTQELKPNWEYSWTRNSGSFIQRVGSQVLPGMEYVHILPSNHFMNQMKPLFRDALLFFSLLAGSGAVLIALVASSTYKPYVRVVQANEALLEITRKSRLSMKEKFFRDVLFGNLSGEQLEQQAHSLGISERRPVTVVLLKPGSYREWTERYSGGGIREMLGQLRILVEEGMKDTDYILLELHSGQFALGVFGLDAAEAERRVYRIKEHIRSGLGLDLVAAIGRSVRKLAELHASFQEALEALEFKAGYEGEVIINTGQLGELAEANAYYPLDVEKELIQGVIQGRTDQVAELVRQVLHENMSRRRLSPHAVSSWLFALAATANRILQQLQRQPDDVFDQGFNIYKELLTYSSMDELEEKVESLFRKMARHQEEQRRPGHDAELLLGFIHDHYATDLALTDVARHFQLSEGYAGKWFKERTGENFKDYLNMYRVRMAKKIMDEETIRIEDLARRVGCNNTVTLNRMFKKYEGISPSQYVRQDTGEGERR